MIFKQDNTGGGGREGLGGREGGTEGEGERGGEVEGERERELIQGTSYVLKR